MEKVYLKSQKAIKEFEAGNRTLSLRHRQLLIMIDGVRTTSALIKLFNMIDASQMLHDLERLGYLIDKNASARPGSFFESEQSENKDVLENLSQTHLKFVKSFLINELQNHVGILGRDLVNKIDFVQSSQELKPYISRWHMAIRESRVGRVASDKLMERLCHLIANPPSMLASELIS